MVSNNKDFVCSSPIFNGFKCVIDMNYCDNLNDIVNKFRETLRNTLLNHNLDNLVKMLNESVISINNYEFNDILLSEEDIVYIIHVM